MLSHVTTGRIEHRPSKIHGTGSFSTSGHKAGEILGVALVKVNEDADDQDQSAYWQTLLGDFFNHSPVANVSLKKDGNKLIAYTTKDIAPGEEMLADYREKNSPVQGDASPDWDQRALKSMAKKGSVAVKKGIVKNKFLAKYHAGGVTPKMQK